ncbi:MAG: hypothetical protein ACE361_26200 [Aureliella sp.]
MDTRTNRERQRVALRQSQIVGNRQARKTNHPSDKKQPTKTNSPPVHTFTNGFVTTRIWKNVDKNSQVTWRVCQYRIRIHSGSGTACKSFGPEHMDDAVRGLKLAQGWIHRHGGNRRGRSLFRKLLSG